MKTHILVIFSIVCIILSSSSLEAMGGRGGGGRAQHSSRQARPNLQKRPTGHQALSKHTPKQNYNRTPSLSRAAPRTDSRHQQAQALRAKRAAEKKVSGQYAKGKTPSRSQVQTFLKDNPQVKKLPAQAAQRKPGDLSKERFAANPPQAKEKLSQRKLNPQERKQQFQKVSNHVRDNFRKDYPNSKNWFNQDFFASHDYHPRYDFKGRDPWKWATFGAIAGWVGTRWIQPYNYGYGYYDAPYYYGDGNDYDSNDNYAYPVQDYQEQAQEIAETALGSDNDQWMPLGVFAVTSDDQSGEATNIYLQLALNKGGDIAGTLYNSTFDKNYPLEGMVDSESQRAAWMMADNENSPIVETGIYNLTQDETPVRVNFPDGSVQNRLLVRLKKP